LRYELSCASALAKLFCASEIRTSSTMLAWTEGDMSNKRSSEQKQFSKRERILQ
jgi:hypothetical protein